MEAIKYCAMSRSQVSLFSLYLFYFVAVANLLEQIVQTTWLDFATKPLLMPLLLIYFLSSPGIKNAVLSRLMIGGVLFSWLGDVLLMLQAKFDGMFVFGLTAFLFAHIFYIFLYRSARFEEQQSENKSFVNTRVIFLIFIGAALIYMLRPALGELLVPVVLYTIVIIAMGIFALLRRGWTIEKSFIMVYSGALLFIMSDAMIAINKFMNPIVQARLLIMATYIAAQFLIVKGIRAHAIAEGEDESESSS